MRTHPGITSLGARTVNCRMPLDLQHGRGHSLDLSSDSPICLSWQTESPCRSSFPLESTRQKRAQLQRHLFARPLIRRAQVSGIGIRFSNADLNGDWYWRPFVVCYLRRACCSPPCQGKLTQAPSLQTLSLAPPKQSNPLRLLGHSDCYPLSC